MVKKLLSFIIVLLIAISGVLLITAEDETNDPLEQDKHIKSLTEETDPLILEARLIIEQANNLFLATSKEELETIINDTWTNPAIAMEINEEIIDWTLSREANITKVDTIFSNETITSTENDDFITYTATVDITLLDENGKEIGKEVTGIFNIAKDEENNYKIQNIQLLEPAKRDE